MNEQRKWFLEIESTPGKDAVKTVEMKTKYLEHYINLVDKAVVGFERTDSNFERRSTVDKMLSNITACYREIVHERKSQLVQQTSLMPYFKKWPQPPHPSANTTLINRSHQHKSKILYQQKDYNTLKARFRISIFLAIKYFHYNMYIIF